ncbi:MAG: sigma-70 factor domain-containing protein, partial [Verrucomicrobiota bacterium]
MPKPKDRRLPSLSVTRRSRRRNARPAADSSKRAPRLKSRNRHATRLHGRVLPRPTSAEIAEKVKELIRMAGEQGYLTYGDIHEALSAHLILPEERDEIHVTLRNLDIDIVDQAELDRVKQPEREEETDKARLDILDDPVRMYLKQMGQVPLLTRDQEVQISRRIENAEAEITKIIYSLGFAGKEHIALAEKLVANPPKERFDRVI